MGLPAIEVLQAASAPGAGEANCLTCRALREIMVRYPPSGRYKNLSVLPELESTPILLELSMRILKNRTLCVSLVLGLCLCLVAIGGLGCKKKGQGPTSTPTEEPNSVAAAPTAAEPAITTPEIKTPTIELAKPAAPAPKSQCTGGDRQRRGDYRTRGLGHSRPEPSAEPSAHGRRGPDLAGADRAIQAADASAPPGEPDHPATPGATGQGRSQSK